MGILKYFWPIYLIKVLFKMTKDLENFIFYIQQVNRIKRDNAHTLYSVKIDKINRIYTVINLPPEILLAENRASLSRQEKEIVGAKLGKFEKLLQDYNIYELIKYRYTRIKNEEYYAYLVYIIFRPYYFSIWWLLWIGLYGYFLVNFLIDLPWVNWFNYIVTLF